MAGKSFIFRFSDFEAHEREFSLVKAGETFPVEPKAFRVLLILLRNPKKLAPKEELLNAVWGDAAVTENSLTRAIALLRRLLGDDAREPKFIETVTSVGYRWLCPVVAEEIAGADSSATEPAERSPKAATLADANLTKKGGRRRLWPRALGAVALPLLVFGIWYLRRPLPPPRITDYTQITHDGHKKNLVGTDGNKIYLSWGEHFGVPTGVGQVAVSGGVVAPIPVELPHGYQADHLEDVSPDGSALLIASFSPSEAQLWNVRTLGGSLRRLPWVWRGATFSPDGNSVAYPSDDGEIWLVRSDGTGAHKLASVAGAEELAWSPDGRAIRFTKDHRLWEISSSGSNLHQLFPTWHASTPKCCGRWTPDGRFFLFISGESVFTLGAVQPAPQGGDIWALDERRGSFRRPSAEPVQLTTGPTRWGPPLPGKDGKTIFSLGTTLRGELSRYDSQTKQLQPFLGGISAQGVTFSKDGRFVAYVSYPENALWRANRDGSNPVQLTHSPMKVYLPRFSPDGTEILFVDQSNPVHFESYLVSSEGGRPQRLIPDDPGQQSDPSWSPDGRKVVFDIGDTNPSHEIRVLDLDSSQVTTVPGSSGLYSARWSPDGRYIAALEHKEPEGLTIFDFETQRWSAPFHMWGLGFPQWSSDSQWIFFEAASSEGSRGIYRIRVTGGEAEHIADVKVQDWTGWFFTWFGLDPTDAPLVLRDVGSNDIYVLTLEVK